MIQHLLTWAKYKIEELSDAALSELTIFVSKSDGLSKLCGGTEEDIRSYLKPKADLAAKAALNLAQGGAGPEITHNLTFLALYDLIILIGSQRLSRFYTDPTDFGRWQLVDEIRRGR